MDLLIAVPVLFVLAPLMIAIALVVRLDLGSPVIFRHVRPGRGGRLFKVLKFRSMAPARDANGNVLPDDSPEAYAAARAGQRQTRFGELIRRTSLDELPELFNVISGAMSLVGPRPLLAEYLDRYTPEQMRRHEIRPGVTGWAQIHGRQAISYEDRFVLDVWYVDHLSLGLDIKIIAKTLLDVLRRRGTNEPGYSTGTEFMGSAKPDGPDPH